MKTISQAELNKMSGRGAKVSRKMGTAKPSPKPKKEAAPPPAKKEVEMASMSVSMAHLETQAKATVEVLARNTEVINDFRKEMAANKPEPKKVPYVFDVERGNDKLITRIVATPQLK